MDDYLKDYVQKLEHVETIEEYDACIRGLMNMLLKDSGQEDVVRYVRTRGRYMVNRFSDVSTEENMMRAREDLLCYLRYILEQEQKVMPESGYIDLERYLQYFYLFLESIRETATDKRVSITPMEIENEYDLQHLLYAALKPIFPDLRREVAEDSGLGMVRSDMCIPSLDTIIEVKCTRKNMSLKVLTEQLEADMVHYMAERIYFYIYDKERIIKDRETFLVYFNRKFDCKTVRTVLLQPVYI